MRIFDVHLGRLRSMARNQIDVQLIVSCLLPLLLHLLLLW